MIERLLELARRRADGGADALWRQVERTAVAFEWGRLKAAGVSEEAGANVRVRHRGRIGVAGTTAVDASPGDVLTRALASAELGEELALVFPAPAPVPPVATFFHSVADASLDRLMTMALPRRAARARGLPGQRHDRA